MIWVSSYLLLKGLARAEADAGVHEQLCAWHFAAGACKPKKKLEKINK